MKREEAKRKYGENLKKLRIARGLSQDELAKALGYTNRSSINKIEIGRSNIPTDKIARTAEVLGVSPLELFKADDMVDEVHVIAGGSTKDMPIISVIGEDTLPSGAFHGGLNIRADLWMEFSRLSDRNQEQAMTYIKYLAELQKKEEENNDEQS